MSVKIIDCTIRDGGHRNKWAFSDTCLKDSYLAALEAGVGYFETGYRNKNRGVSDEYLSNLMDYSPKCKLTVMTDISKADISLFNDASKSPIKAVRIAAYPKELREALLLLECLKSKGYEVFLFLMTAPRLLEEHFDLLRAWESKDILECITMADSFGSAYPKDIERVFLGLKSCGFLSIGIHAHNNLQLAFANTLKAIELGATFADATIYGISRGSGGVPAELLCAYLGKDFGPYFKVIEKHYLEEYKKNPWGYSLETLLCGLNDTHSDKKEKEILKCQN